MFNKNTLTTTRSKKGFTLLELLFVVAILATIATFALSTYRQRTINIKVSQASLQAQQILQAATVYYLQEAKWPEQGKTSGVDFEEKFLPLGKLPENPWGYGYVYKPTNPDPSKGLFDLATQVPTEMLANRIVARLPNAEVRKDPKSGDFSVGTQITIPGQQVAGEQGVLIKKIGKNVLRCGSTNEANGRTQTFFVNFSCNNVKGRRVAVSIDRYYSEKPVTGYTVLNRTAGLNKNVVCKNDEGQTPCEYELILDMSGGNSFGCPANAYISTTYIAYCCPPGTEEKEAECPQLKF